MYHFPLDGPGTYPSCQILDSSFRVSKNGSERSISNEGDSKNFARSVCHLASKSTSS
jgi:hypothetical protein